MNTRTVLQLVLLACIVIAGTEAQRRRGNYPTRPPPPDGDYTAWTRRLSPTVTVNETGFVSSEYDVAIVKSVDWSMTQLGYRSAMFYYDYEAEEPILVVALKGHDTGGACLITNPDLTFDDIQEQILERNNTMVDLPDTTIGLNFFSRRPMRRDHALEFANDHPLVVHVCPVYSFVDIRNETRDASETNVRVIKTLGLDNIIEISTSGTNFGRGRRGRGGRGNCGRRQASSGESTGNTGSRRCPRCIPCRRRSRTSGRSSGSTSGRSSNDQN